MRFEKEISRGASEYKNATHYRLYQTPVAAMKDLSDESVSCKYCVFINARQECISGIRLQFVFVSLYFTHVFCSAMMMTNLNIKGSCADFVLILFARYAHGRTRINCVCCQTMHENAVEIKTYISALLSLSLRDWD